MSRSATSQETTLECYLSRVKEKNYFNGVGWIKTTLFTVTTTLDFYHKNTLISWIKYKWGKREKIVITFECTEHVRVGM